MKLPRSGTDPPNSTPAGGVLARRFLNRRFRLVLSLFLAAALAISLIYWDVVRRGAPIVANRNAVPPMPVAIVFGAGYSNTYGPGAVLFDRVQSAVGLYRAGKVQKLLMTGDNGHVGYSEPAAMRRCALRMGVPDRDIVLDYAGFRTYDSLYRARDIFSVHSAILVTQRYHLSRALYLAHALGMQAVGYPADRPGGYGRSEGALHRREFLAIENAWLEVNILHPRPRFLGKREPIQFENLASLTAPAR